MQSSQIDTSTERSKSDFHVIVDVDEQEKTLRSRNLPYLHVMQKHISKHAINIKDENTELVIDKCESQHTSKTAGIRKQQAIDIYKPVSY